MTEFNIDVTILVMHFSLFLFNFQALAFFVNNNEMLYLCKHIIPSF